MGTEENKAVVRRFVEEFKNRANHGIVDELFTQDFIHHFPDPRLPKGRTGEKALGQSVLTGLPDVHATIEDLIAEGDKVVERTYAEGTHKGEFFGVPATGKKISWTEIHIYRLKNGKVAEHWPEIDALGIMTQLGVIPTPK